MDITTIEATSVAIRVGQVAAAELCSLLTHEEEDAQPMQDWFEPKPWPIDDLPAWKARAEELSITIDKLGGYVCHSPEPVTGERLYRWAAQESLIGRGQWLDQSFERRQAFEHFAHVTRSVYLPLKAEQVRLEAAGAEPPKQLGLALEDSIFEPEDGFNDIVPGMEKLADVLDHYAPPAAEPDPAPEAAAEPAKPPPKPRKSLSIGEAPVQPSVNRGGRGRTRENG